MKRIRELDMHVEAAIQRASEQGDNRSDPFVKDRLRLHYRMGIWDPAETKASEA